MFLNLATVSCILYLYSFPFKVPGFQEALVWEVCANAFDNADPYQNHDDCNLLLFNAR